MKKLLFCFISLVLIFILSTTTLAGSCPEDLKVEGQIFFAQIIEYNKNEDEKKSTVELIPVKIIKGEVKLGEQFCYAKAIPMGDFEIENNKVYLITYYDEVNPTYIFRSTSYDTKELDLPDVNQYDMWNRFQSYLNDGTYDKLETQRQEKLGVLDTKMQIEGELPELDNPLNNPNNNLYSIFIILIITVIIISLLILIKFAKKKK